MYALVYFHLGKIWENLDVKMMRLTEKITITLLKTLAKENFTEAKIISDTELQGFQVRTGKKGITFYLRKFHNKKMLEKTIGHYPIMTLEEAKAEALRIISSLVNNNLTDIVVAKKDPTVGEAIDAYIQHLKNGYNALTFFKPWEVYRNRFIKDLSKDDVLNIKNSLSAHPVMSNHCVKYLGSAINYLAKCLETDLPNPALNMPKYKTHPRKRFLSDQEAPLLMQKLVELSTKALYSSQADALLMMIYTGQRKSNVLHMNLSDITDNNVWIIKDSESKNGREIIVPLNDYAMEIVEKRKDNALHGYLFHRRGVVLQDVRKTFHTACAAVGVEDCHIHDLRRTLGSWMLMNGTPIEVVSRTLGHSSIRVTEQVYAHLLPKKISDATGSAIGAMLKGKI